METCYIPGVSIRVRRAAVETALEQHRDESRRRYRRAEPCEWNCHYYRSGHHGHGSVGGVIM